MQITYQKYVSQKTRSNDNLPVITEWQNEKFIRSQSLKAAVKEILNLSESLDFCKINIIGPSGTGKSTLALSLAHILHMTSELPFAVKVFNRDNLLNMEATLKTLTATNWILLFDDLSFLGATANKKQIEIVKRAFSEVRHLEGAADVKIIAILNFHYSYGLDKFLRQSNFTFYTQVAGEESDNMLKVLGSKNQSKIEHFQQISQQAIMKKKWAVKLGNKKGNWFIYKYRQPFSPALFYNSISLREVIFPKREWIDPLCSVCTSQNIPLKDKDGNIIRINIDDFAKQMKSKFGEQIGRNAVRIVLSQNGIDVWPKRVKQAMKFIDQYLLNKEVNLQQIADHYHYDCERTRLDAKLDEPIKTE